MPNSFVKKEEERLISQMMALFQKPNAEKKGPLRKVKEHNLDGFMDVMRNADAVAYFVRQQTIGDDDKNRGNLWYLWKRYPTSREEFRWGALDTFEARTDSLRFEQDSSGKLQIYFRKESTLVKVSRKDEKRFAAMALVVRELICADNAKFISVVSAVSTALRDAKWKWDEASLFLEAVALGSAQKFGKEAFAEAERAHSEGGYDTLEDVFGNEKAAILRACLDGADRQ